MAELNDALTEREIEIVKLVATGITNKEIATTLSISPSTIKVHLNNIFTKLDVHSRTELTMIAVKNGWVALEANDNTVTNNNSPDSVLLPRTAPASQPQLRTSLWKKAAIITSAIAILVTSVVRAPSATTNNVDDPTLAAEQGNELLARGETSRWFQRAALPASRTRAAAVTVGNLIYLIGGEVNQAPSAEVLTYSIDTNTWQLLDTLKPTPTWSNTAVALNDKIYAAGGTTSGNRFTNRFEVYDTRTKSWNILADLPIASSGHSMVGSGKKIYAFGFNPQSGGKLSTADSYVYDIGNNTWQPIASMPTQRTFTGAALMDDKIFVVGGYSGGREVTMCEAYAPQSNEWSKCPDMLVPRGAFGLTKVSNLLFAIGGGGSGFIGFNERYDTTSNTWQPIDSPLNGDWQNFAITSRATELYVIGGVSNNKKLAFNYAFELFNKRTYLPDLAKGDNQNP
jgi:DNA-binding CsgD family transcriptional regulator/N-acetylneuraminic acid mutarotase